MVVGGKSLIGNIGIDRKYFWIVNWQLGDTITIPNLTRDCYIRRIYCIGVRIHAIHAYRSYLTRTSVIGAGRLTQRTAHVSKNSSTDAKEHMQTHANTQK